MSFYIEQRFWHGTLNGAHRVYNTEEKQCYGKQTVPYFFSCIMIVQIKNPCRYLAVLKRPV